MKVGFTHWRSVGNRAVGISKGDTDSTTLRRLWGDTICAVAHFESFRENGYIKYKIGVKAIKYEIATAGSSTQAAIFWLK